MAAFLDKEVVDGLDGLLSGNGRLPFEADGAVPDSFPSDLLRPAFVTERRDTFSA